MGTVMHVNTSLSLLIVTCCIIRPEYGLLLLLKSHFPGVPLMALTATATLEVKEEIISIMNEPLLEISTVNKKKFHSMFKSLKNYQKKVIIFMHLILSCVNLTGTTDYYMTIAGYVTEVIGRNQSIVYTDFVKDVAPLAIALKEKGINSSSYHGKNLSSHDKVKIIENWCLDDSIIQASQA